MNEVVVSDKNKLFVAVETECHHLKVEPDSEEILKVWIKEPTWLQVEQALSTVLNVDAQNQAVIGKITKLEPKIEIKESFLNQVHKQDLSGITRKEVHVNEVLKAKNLAAENKVRQKARPSFEELKNDLKSLSQLIHSAHRRVKNQL